MRATTIVVHKAATHSGPQSPRGTGNVSAAGANHSPSCLAVGAGCPLFLPPGRPNGRELGNGARRVVEAEDGVALQGRPVVAMPHDLLRDARAGNDACRRSLGAGCAVNLKEQKRPREESRGRGSVRCLASGRSYGASIVILKSLERRAEPLDAGLATWRRDSPSRRTSVWLTVARIRPALVRVAGICEPFQ